MRTMSTALSAALQKNGCRPIVTLTLENASMKHNILTVVNYQSASGGDVSLTRSGGEDAFTWTEGVDFTAATSNEATAEAIFDAMVEANDENTYIYREPYSNQVHVVYANGNTTLTSTVSGVAAGAAGSVTAAFSSGKDRGLGYFPNTLLEFKTSGSRVDPVSRESSIGSADALLDDSPFIRRLFSVFFMRNAKVDIRLGEESTDDSFILSSYRLNDIRREEGGIRLTLSEPSNILAEKTCTGQMITRHPLDAISKILTRCSGTGAFDTSTLALSSISQNLRGYCISRAQEWHVSHNWYYQSGSTFRSLGQRFAYIHNAGGDTQSTAWDYIQEILMAFGGTVYADAVSGKLKYKEFDLNANPDWYLTREDIAEFQQISAFDNAITNVTIPIGQCELGTYTNFARRENSALNLSVGNDVDFRADYTINSPYFNHVGSLMRCVNDVGTLSFLYDFTPSYAASEWILERTAASGFTFGQQVVSGQTSSAELHADQVSTAGVEEGVAILRVDQLRFNYARNLLYDISEGITPMDNSRITDTRFLHASEYVAVTPNTITANTHTVVNGVDGDDGARPELTHFSIATGYNANGFTSGRGGFGTTQLTEGTVQDETLVVDVTLAFKRAKEILTRFAFGAPVIEFTLPLHFAGIEIGDVFQLTGEDRYIGYQQNRTDAARFEVTSVTHSFIGGSPGIRVEGTFMRLDDPFEIFFSTDDPAPTEQRPNPLEEYYVVDNDGTPVWEDAGDSTTQVLGY